MKSRLTSSPILRLPVFNEGKPFILRSDASDIGIRAVLLQKFEGEGKLPIAYASKKLLPRERNYSVIEKECLAIIWAIEKFSKYLFGEEFIMECDHKPLSFMQTAKALNPRIMRWALKLQPYRFRIVAIQGQDNVGADYLSSGFFSGSKSLAHTSPFIGILFMTLISSTVFIFILFLGSSRFLQFPFLHRIL